MKRWWTTMVLAVLAVSGTLVHGQITGTVTFAGEVPQPRLIDMSKDPYCASAHANNPATMETMVVGASGGLANVVLYVSQGLPAGVGVPSQPVQFDQRGCQFVRHVAAIDAGQTMRLMNSDQTSHNIHPAPTKNAEWNKSQPPGAPPIEVSWANEDVIPVKCNIHPWMRSYIVVVRGPYAVTDDGGSFSLDGIPPGNYTLTAWHESYGAQTQTVAVNAGQPGVVNFTFPAGAEAVAPAPSPTRSNAAPQCTAVDQMVQVDDSSGVAASGGPGHCKGEADYWLTNSSTQAIDCAFIFHKNGKYDPNSVLISTLAPGQGKISTCGADTGEMQFRCFSHAQNTAAQCTAKVQWQ